MQEKIPNWVSFSGTLYGLLRGLQHPEILNYISLPVNLNIPGTWMRACHLKSKKKKKQIFFENVSLFTEQWQSLHGFVYKTPLNLLQALEKKKYEIIAVEKTWTSSGKKRTMYKAYDCELMSLLYCG